MRISPHPGFLAAPAKAKAPKKDKKKEQAVGGSQQASTSGVSTVTQGMSKLRWVAVTAPLPFLHRLPNCITRLNEFHVLHRHPPLMQH